MPTLGACHMRDCGQRPMGYGEGCGGTSPSGPARPSRSRIPSCPVGGCGPMNHHSELSVLLRTARQLAKLCQQGAGSWRRPATAAPPSRSWPRRGRCTPSSCERNTRSRACSWPSSSTAPAADGGSTGSRATGATSDTGRTPSQRRTITGHGSGAAARGEAVFTRRRVIANPLPSRRGAP
jgi:hypothetical protein